MRYKQLNTEKLEVEVDNPDLKSIGYSDKVNFEKEVLWIPRSQMRTKPDGSIWASTWLIEQMEKEGKRIPVAE